MLIGTLRTKKVMIFVFGSLVLLFVLLGLGDYLGNTDITHVAGWVGLVCGALALYLAAADILNEVYGRVILPIFPAGTKKVLVQENKAIEMVE